jgi:predicted DNA-binding transcriptional regulator AlpA
MSVGPMTDTQPKAAITVSKMCSLLGMSRSQFYWHVKKGTFHQPLRLSNGRPYFNAGQVEGNLKAKELGISVSGEYVLFYARDNESKSIEKLKPKQDFTELMEALSSLGLKGLTTTVVVDAVEHCYPQGSDGHDENEILRTVFRHLKRSGSF